VTQTRPIRRRSSAVHIGRRQFLIRSGWLGGAVLLGPGLLSACGDDDDDDDAAGGGGGGGENALVISNWPAYIDEETVDLFREETGIDLTYNEDFIDNDEYFARIVPDLSEGRPIEADIIVPTYWLAERLIELGWVEEIPFDDIPNAENLATQLQNPPWDPDGLYSLPWQSGMTGIAYNVAETGRELTSVEDLFDPAFRGRIGMLTEMQDTVGLVMLGTGNDPTEATFESATEAFDLIEQAANNGQIRQFTGNDYMDDLASGNFVACIGWSGDISQLALDNPDLRFTIPEEGGMRWSDTMVIPAGARNVAAAATWMNYVYDPVNAARIAAYIGYVSPVDGVQDELRGMGEFEATLADSALMFPDDATLDQLHVFADLEEEERAQFDERFSEIIGA
jgi:spermidine/putrescine transport system substrate-binding protein